MASMSAILSPAQTADKPKLLDQRVKALLTRLE
jgi:hypothetical protein